MKNPIIAPLLVPMEDLRMDVELADVTPETWGYIAFQWVQYIIYMRGICPMIFSEFCEFVSSVKSPALAKKYTKVCGSLRIRGEVEGLLVEQFIEQINEIGEILRCTGLQGCGELLVCLGNNYNIPSEIFHLRSTMSPSAGEKDGKHSAKLLIRQMTSSMSVLDTMDSGKWIIHVTIV